MKIYAVGGQVRDNIIGVLPKDKDYVVVGSTPTQMIQLGYTQVGASFPVFLKNGEEYALARTERKTGVGYNGFDTFFDCKNSINPILLDKFIELGYDPDLDYDYCELLKVFQRINQ